jgi:hypothetical protein
VSPFNYLNSPFNLDQADETSHKIKLGPNVANITLSTFAYQEFFSFVAVAARCVTRNFKDLIAICASSESSDIGSSSNTKVLIAFILGIQLELILAKSVKWVIRFSFVIGTI